MMVGEGDYRDINSQPNYLTGAYPQISAAALRAWKKLPNSDKKTEDLSKNRQGPDEPYQDFVARLLEAIGKVIGDEQAGMVLAKQLAYENANSPCQAALRPYRKKGMLIRLCTDLCRYRPFVRSRHNFGRSITKKDSQKSTVSTTKAR